MRVYLVSAFLLIASVTYGQNDIPLLKDYTIEVWSTDQGLPSNNLLRIDQDRKGFLWITSYNGLIRFDGHTFDIYNTENLPQLKSNGFSFITKSSGHSMYFGTLTSGLLEYDGENFSIEKIDNDFSGSINAIHLARNGRLWIGVKNKGIYIKESKDGAFTQVENNLLDNSTIQCILEPSAGEIWMATDNHGIVQYKEGQYHTVQSTEISSSSISTLAQFNDIIYAGTSNGLYEHIGNDWSVVKGTEGFSINSIKQDNIGNIWIATETGLLRLDQSAKVEYLSESDGLPSRQISSILIDNEGNIWLTSKRGGLVQLRNSNFVNISVEDGLSNQYTNIICELDDGSVAIGNDNGGIDILKDGQVTRLAIQTNLRNTSIKDIIQDKRGNLWIATYKGLLRIDHGHEHLYDLSSGMVSLNIRSLFEDSNGNIWVGAKDGGLVKINRNAQRTIFNQSNGLSDNYIFCFEELSDGRVIAGTYHGGLNIISADNSVEIINIGTDTSSPLIFNIDIENDSTFWLATDVGLYRYYNGVFNRLDLEDGLKVATIFDIVHDELGYLWATSNLGVVRLDKNEVLSFFDGKIDKVNARLYDEKDGMISRECTGATRVMLSSKGEIWIPTSKGVTIVDPNNIYVNRNLPPIYIKSVMLDNTIEYPNPESVTVGPGSQRVSIDYTALSYYSPQKINFKYRLKGYDADWQDVGNQYEAIYMNLPDGKFTFEVIASNNDGFWNEAPATIQFDVEPHFYTSRMFYLLLLGFVLLITFIIYWIRIRVVEEKNRELNKLNAELDSFVYSVSHDLRAPLSSILGLISVSKIDNDVKNLPVYLEKIEGSVNKLDDFIKEIISYSRNVRLNVDPEDIDLKELINETIESLAYMNTDNAIDISIESTERTVFRTDRTRLQVILNNIISNAFRYYKSYINDPYVKIKISVLNEKATIVVEDNGIGIKKDQQKKIFDMFYRATDSSSGSGLGLYIALESADKIDGKIKVESEYQKGTTFTITLNSL